MDQVENFNHAYVERVLPPPPPPPPPPRLLLRPPPPLRPPLSPPAAAPGAQRRQGLGVLHPSHLFRLELRAAAVGRNDVGRHHLHCLGRGARRREDAAHRPRQGAIDQSCTINLQLGELKFG